MSAAAERGEGVTSGRLSGRRERRATADAKQGAVAGSESESTTQPRRVSVAGHVIVDGSLARTRKVVDSGIAWNADDRIETYGQPSGAALMAGLMIEVSAKLIEDGVRVDVSGPGAPAEPIAPADPRFNHSYAIWARFPSIWAKNGESQV